MLKRNVSAFDYTVTITRKHRYLVVSSPEFGFQIASGILDLERVSPEQIGRAVLDVLGNINARLHQLEQKGEPQPAPMAKAKLIQRDVVSARRAAQILGVSLPTLRKIVAQGSVRAERTPGGHLRFSLDSLSEYLVEQQTRQHLRQVAQSRRSEHQQGVA